MGFTEWLAKKSFLSKRADFYDDVAENMRDNASFYEEMVAARDRARKKKNTGEANLYGLIIRRQSEGASLANSLRGIVPAEDLMAIESAEASGDPARGLMFASKIVRGVSELRGALIGAMAYPTILILVMMIFLYIFSYKVMPTFEQIYSADKWPAIGRALHAVTTFVQGYGIFATIVIGLLVGWMIWSLPNWSGTRSGTTALRDFLDKIPILPWMLYREYMSAVFLVSLAALMEAGVSLEDALNKLRARSSPWMSRKIGSLLRNLRANPSEPAQAFRGGFMPERISDRIDAYGRRSNFQAAVTKLGIGGMERTIKEVKGKAKFLNVFLMLVAGGMLAFMFTGTIFTAMDMQRGIKAQINTNVGK